MRKPYSREPLTRAAIEAGMLRWHQVWVQHSEELDVTGEWQHFMSTHGAQLFALALAAVDRLDAPLASLRASDAENPAVPVGPKPEPSLPVSPPSPAVAKGEAIPPRMSSGRRVFAGSAHAADLSGFHVGTYVAVEPTGERYYGQVVWRFRCPACGSERTSAPQQARRLKRPWPCSCTAKSAKAAAALDDDADGPDVDEDLLEASMREAADDDPEKRSWYDVGTNQDRGDGRGDEEDEP